MTSRKFLAEVGDVYFYLEEDNEGPSIKIYHQEIPILEVSLDEFVEFCHTIAVTRVMIEVALGRVCKECLALLYPSTVENLHLTHTATHPLRDVVN